MLQTTSQSSTIYQEGTRFLASLNEAAAPEGDTLRAREINARGVAVCALGKVSSKGQPTTVNRELTYRQAKPDTGWRGETPNAN